MAAATRASINASNDLGEPPGERRLPGCRQPSEPSHWKERDAEARSAADRIGRGDAAAPRRCSHRLSGASSDGAELSPAARIPGELVPIIERAADPYCDLPAPLLAAILKVESNFNNAAVNPDSGAFTMAQFLPRTWAEWAVNGNPDDDATVDPADVADVIFTAARYLCALGAGNPDTQRFAVAAYNAGPVAVQRAGGIPHEAECPDGHPASLDKFCQTADYVRKVFTQAAAYAADSTGDLPTGGLLARVIGFAYAKIGTPTSGAPTAATGSSTAPG